jgi:hypothetical protein
MAEERHELADQSRHKRLGVASYRAVRAGGSVVLFATGDTPTPNYKVWLHAARDEDGSLVHELWWLPPTGPQIFVLSPFSVHVGFRCPAGTDKLVVRDDAGVHGVEIEDAGELAKDVSALVYLHYANQFDLRYEGKAVSFTEANIAGDPLLSIGDRFFYGDEVRLRSTELGQLVTVTTKAVVDGDSRVFSLLLPPTRVSGYEPVEIEALVIEGVERTTIAGPPIGAGVLYEKVRTVKAHASFLVS